MSSHLYGDVAEVLLFYQCSATPDTECIQWRCAGQTIATEQIDL